jgi:LDH2 family malate/lactate/ureidoglycolate dehydrogenase
LCLLPGGGGGGCLISQAEVLSFIERCMTAVGTKAHHAKSLAQVLVEGDCRGHYSHGLNRMGPYTHRHTGIQAHGHTDTQTRREG